MIALSSDNNSSVFQQLSELAAAVSDLQREQSRRLTRPGPSYISLPADQLVLPLPFVCRVPMSLVPGNHMGFSLPSMHEQGVVPAAHTPAVVAPPVVDVTAPLQHKPAGAVSPPASCCSTGTAVGTACRNSPATSSDVTNRHQQPRMGVASIVPGSSSGGYKQSREWLYKLVTFPAYFTPCITCCSGSRTPKREQLMTLFDTRYPYKVYCSHCPECQVQGIASLLQVRRASFKDVVKATDICRFGADVSGVQQYTLNGSKVIYLNREQTIEKKNNNGAAAPAICTVDGRAMMDKASLYCSLKCKMHAEDAGFTCWLDQQDPSVRCAAAVGIGGALLPWQGSSGWDAEPPVAVQNMLYLSAGQQSKLKSSFCALANVVVMA